MAAKINWHRYGTKLRHCHPMRFPVWRYDTVYLRTITSLVVCAVFVLLKWSVRSRVRAVQFDTFDGILGFSSGVTTVLVARGRQKQRRVPPGFLSNKQVSNKCIAVRKVATPLRELTCHMGSHSVTCHPAEVTFPPLPEGRSARGLKAKCFTVDSPHERSHRPH